jgi:antibiotic biosynthesis monooxygenase (ABM) superfamily enzyme
MTFEGHLGVHVIRPGPGSRDYTTIFRFSTPKQLRAWLDSDLRARRLRESEDLFTDPSQVQELSGLEAWFTLPGRSTATPPPRYKMALTTFVAVFSLLMVIPRLLAPLIDPMPPLSRTLVVCATMVALLTYVVMPALTRALSGWLYPRRDVAQRAPDEA